MRDVRAIVELNWDCLQLIITVCCPKILVKFHGEFNAFIISFTLMYEKQSLENCHHTIHNSINCHGLSFKQFRNHINFIAKVSMPNSNLPKLLFKCAYTVQLYLCMKS